MRMSAADFRKRLTKTPSKFGNERFELDGIVFASKAEAKRYAELKLLQAAGEIIDLELQPRFPLEACSQKLGEYRADFQYKVVATGETVTEDVKSAATEVIPLFRWKLKHFEAQYGRKLQVVK